MPKALLEHMGMSFFFYSGEHSREGLEPIHVHVSHGKPSKKSSKIWVKVDGTVELCHNDGKLTHKELAAAMLYIKTNGQNVRDKWNDHFKDSSYI